MIAAQRCRCPSIHSCSASSRVAPMVRITPGFTSHKTYFTECQLPTILKPIFSHAHDAAVLALWSWPPTGLSRVGRRKCHPDDHLSMFILSRMSALHSWSGQRGGVMRLLMPSSQQRSISRRSRSPSTLRQAGGPRTKTIASLQRLRASRLMTHPQSTAAPTSGHLSMTGGVVGGHAVSVDMEVLAFSLWYIGTQAGTCAQQLSCFAGGSMTSLTRLFAKNLTESTVSTQQTSTGAKRLRRSNGHQA